MKFTVTNLLIVLNCSVFMIIYIFNISYYNILFSPVLVLEDYDLKKLIIPTICHVNLLHLLINMISFYNVGNIIECIFEKKYLFIICCISILSKIIHIIFALLEVYVYNNNQEYYSKSIGFSNIVFGLRYIYLKKKNNRVNLLGFDIHSSYVIWIELLISKYIFKNSNFIEYLSGIFAGMLIS